MGAYSKSGRLFVGRVFDNPVSRVGAYSRGCLFEGALNRGITVFQGGRFQPRNLTNEFLVRTYLLTRTSLFQLNVSFILKSPGFRGSD